LGDDLVQEIKSKDYIELSNLPDIQNISIRLALHSKYDPLENMIVNGMEIGRGRVILRCKSQDDLVQVILSLNFRSERLEFDFYESVSAIDDGTERAARQGIVVMRFLLDYFSNGILETWNFQQNELLGRCDAYLPMNVDMNATLRKFEADIQRVETEAARRAVVS
jgi:hypothetical protein